MRHQELVLDTAAYNALFTACERNKMLLKALEAFKEMKQQGVVPDSTTLSAVDSAISENSG